MPFEEVALAEVSRASADAPDALRSYRKGNMGKNAFFRDEAEKGSFELWAARASYRGEETSGEYPVRGAVPLTSISSAHTNPASARRLPHADTSRRKMGRRITNSP